MKKETIIWQMVVLTLGLFMIFTLKTYLENKLVVENIKNEAEIMEKRASCFSNAEEKKLSTDAHCADIAVGTINWLTSKK